MSQRKQYDGAFRARVAVEALRGEKTTNEIASAFGVTPQQVSKWKQQALEELPTAMRDRRCKGAEEEVGPTRDDLLRQIGQLQVELDFLKKASQKLDLLRRGR